MVYLIMLNVAQNWGYNITVTGSVYPRVENLTINEMLISANSTNTQSCTHVDERLETSCATQRTEELKVFQTRLGKRELSVHIKGPLQVLMVKEKT